jgi:acyl-CoA synthetase (AMP-forming)/AMP-acid ligase II
MLISFRLSPTENPPQDILKVSGNQVSPTEIEDTILEHPSGLITDVAVAGVKGERLTDELVPRAWVVLSSLGKQQGAEAVFAALQEWTRTRLSKHKWLRGGIQTINEVSNWYLPRAGS